MYYCFMDNGEVGKCGARMNITGRLKVLNYGKVHEISNGKIEDAGVFHFYPGSESLRVVVPGDNLRSRFYNGIEFDDEIPTMNQKPASVLNQVKKMKRGSILVFGGEPVVSFEFMKDILEKSDGKFVFSSKGFICEDAMREISSKVDAALFEVFSMRDEYYEKLFDGAKLSSVLNAIKIFYDSDKHVEMKMKLVEEVHEDFYDVRKLVSWILNNLDENVPLHFSGETDLVVRARKIAMDAGMNYVYGDFEEGRTTFCSNCKSAVIVRKGDKVQCFLKKGKCKCGKDISGIW